MSIFRCVVALVVGCCALGNIFAAESSEQGQRQSQKVYVDNHRIRAVSRGIIVTCGKQAFLVKAVRRDQKGVFFLRKDRVAATVAAKGDRKRYVCDVCGRAFETEQALLWHQLGHSTNTDAFDD